MVKQAQRLRILRAAMSAIAEIGFHAATVADIVTRARVSRAAFYAQFQTKEECFVAAVEYGRSVLMPKIADAAASASADDLAATLSAVIGEYLRVSASEPEFTRAWALDLAHAGPDALRLRNLHFDELAAVLEMAHVRCGGHNAPLPSRFYLALTGGCFELAYRYAAADRVRDLPELQDEMVDFVLHTLSASRPERDE